MEQDTNWTKIEYHSLLAYWMRKESTSTGYAKEHATLWKTYYLKRLGRLACE